MGGADKGLLELHGLPLVEHVLGRLGASGEQRDDPAPIAISTAIVRSCPAY